MRFSPLLLLAQAAALSSAFLVPPEISEADLKGLVPIDLAATQWSTSRIIRIACDGCPYKEEGVQTDLILDFNVPRGGHKTMSLNGVPIFPLEAIDPTIPLKAVQMPREVDTILYAFDNDLFPMVEIDNSRLITADVITKEGAKEYTLELDILAVSGTPVQLEGVEMTVLESSSGELSFGPVRLTPKGKGCGANLKCLINKMMDKLRNIKTHSVWGGKKGGCHGKTNPVVHGLEGLDMPPSPFDGDMPPPAPPHPGTPHHPHHPHHGGPHHGRPHHGRPHPNHHHNGIFHHIVAQILLPIFVGIVAGMAVSSVGLILCHTLIMLYRKAKGIKCKRGCGSNEGHGLWFGRRMRERRARVRLAALEADGEVEKGLLQEQPLVESPPAYVDEGIEVAEKE